MSPAEDISRWMKHSRRTERNEICAKEAGSCLTAAVNFIAYFTVKSARALAYRDRHGGVRSAAAAEASVLKEYNVGSNALEQYPHLVSEKQTKNCHLCHQGLYLEINISDLHKIFAWMVTYVYHIPQEKEGEERRKKTRRRKKKRMRRKKRRKRRKIMRRRRRRRRKRRRRGRKRTGQQKKRGWMKKTIYTGKTRST